MKEDFFQLQFNKCKNDAEHGDVDAQFKLGQFYECGEGVKADEEKALYWYGKAADQGHDEAIAIFPEKSEQEIPEEEARYYRNQYEQNQKNTSAGSAEFGAAMRYQKGDGTAKSTKKAVKFLKLAAEKNHILAQYNLGLIYQQDSEYKDNKEAVKWFKKAAVNGYDYAQDTLGWMHQYGNGVKKDSKEAVKWYKKAAKQNHVEAQYSLGCMYFEGEGVLKDFKEAAKWFHSSADRGFSKAELKLGDIYINAEGVSKDFKKAAKWFKKCAEKGDFYSQYKLYIHAKEMNMDSEESIDWLHKSAGEDMFIDIFGMLQSESDKEFIIKSYKEAVCIGLAKSQYLLGTLYFENRKNGTDMSKSKYWINKAYENSDKDVTKKAIDFWNKNELWINKNFKYINTTEPSCEEKIRDIVKNTLTLEEKTERELSGSSELDIGFRLQEGLITLRDPLKAIKYFKKATKNLDDKAEAAFELGKIYFEESSIKDHKEAVKWIKKAYESNNSSISKKAEEFWNKHELWNY